MRKFLVRLAEAFLSPKRDAIRFFIRVFGRFSRLEQCFKKPVPEDKTFP